MARETRLANEAAVRALAVAPGERVLEIGFGHGRTVALLAASGVEVDGVDASADMVRVALRRSATAAREGRVRLVEGDSAKLPYADGAFDKALTVHTLYFWPNPVEHLGEAKRVLKPGGTLVLGFREKSDEAVRSFPPPTYHFYSRDEVIGLLRAAGFSAVDVQPATPGILLAVARR
jgi:ubiquinone/menaquinone biosynthesis C-methylase UbiE